MCAIHCKEIRSIRGFLLTGRVTVRIVNLLLNQPSRSEGVPANCQICNLIRFSLGMISAFL